MSVTKYPLAWPAGWKRTAYGARKSHPFARELSFDRARQSLTDELKRLRAINATMSSNVPIRGDGMPYADAARRRMDDPGVAVYFMFKNRPMVMAQDAYYDVAANFRSLALAIEAMRQIERHGGGVMMQKAFDGFAMLEAPAGSKPKRPWWEVLHYPANPDERKYLSIGELDARYKRLAKDAHPDAGGSAEEWNELKTAVDEAKAELQGAV